MTRGLIALLILLLAVPGCTRQLRVDPGPDEFAVKPVRALAEPANYSQLPPPAAGASRAEISSFAMAYQALGGSSASPPRLLGSGAIAQPGGGFLSWLFGGSRPSEALDPRSEAARLSGLGIPTSTRN